jgi:XTP/dITP diphosphohydrolase
MSVGHARAMTTLIIATRNAHKVEEIRGILGAGFQFRTLRDFPGAPPVVEDAATFSGNATKKAVELARYISALEPASSEHSYVLADDSGLEVDALNGAPGVHSARFAALSSDAGPTALGGNSSDADNNAKLLRLLEAVPDEQRSARFRCVIALTPLCGPGWNTGSVCAADEHEVATEVFDGACEGRISRSPSGGKGFGYDPLFVPNGFEQSFADLGEEIKNRISHRAKALEKLRVRLMDRR